jgi:hypothetical protein
VVTISPTPPPAAQSALAGLQQAQRGLDEDAAVVAADGPDVDALVDSGVRRSSAAANVAVLRAADEVSRSLLDCLA